MADIQIQNITEATRDKWLAVAKACPYATYFHTPHWYESIVPNQKHIALEIIFDDNVSAIISFAKIKRKGGLLVDHFSSPGGTYGGWISASPLNDQHVKILTDVLLSKKNLTFKANPFCPSPTPDIFFRDHTHILDLTKGIDKIYNGFYRGHKSAINCAVRNEVIIRASESLEEWDKYYELYMDSIDRWRRMHDSKAPRTIYPRSFFRRLHMARTGREVLWLAFKDNEPIAGALIFYWNRHTVYWHGSASAKHFHLKPNNLLHWEIIKDAINKGYEIYDFNPSAGFEGVESFKERFGSTRISFPMLITRTPLRSLIAKIIQSGESS
ncbi:MAG: GNAT family N-acetyltransferase [Chitinispirillales bacterium]|jgi:hypothetical protein|nr:GNAT family N-acetyltransferase [Chitinispirillales bacterium]